MDLRLLQITHGLLRNAFKNAMRVVSSPHRALNARSLHLAPPYLVDDPYIPRAQRLRYQKPEVLARKVSAAQSAMSECYMCPRKCGWVDLNVLGDQRETFKLTPTSPSVPTASKNQASVSSAKKLPSTSSPLISAKNPRSSEQTAAEPSSSPDVL